jgi:hypothetical protein
MQHGKSSKSKSSNTSLGSDAWWNDGAFKTKSSKKSNLAMSYGDSDLSSSIDSSWQVSKGSDSISSSPSSQSHQSSKKSAGSNTSGGNITSSKSQNGLHAGGQSGKGHVESSSAEVSDYSPTESTQSTKSSKKAPVQINKSPPPSANQSEEISMEDYNEIKYWAEKKWQNMKHLEKSAGVRVGVGSSTCPTSRLLLMSSTLAIPMLLGYTLC